LLSTAPEQVLGYGPPLAALPLVAVVEQVGGVVRLLALSPFTKPL
jgi:hypothetical protein